MNVIKIIWKMIKNKIDVKFNIDLEIIAEDENNGKN